MVSTQTTAQQADPSQSVQWPRGFTFNFFRLLKTRNTWKALCWSYVMTILALPLLVVCGFVITIPPAAAVIDWLARRGAQWMGMTVIQRPRSGWLDWRLIISLAAQVILSSVCLIITLMLSMMAIALTAELVMLGINGSPHDYGLTFGDWQPPIAVSIGFDVLTVFSSFAALVYAGWFFTGASMYVTTAANLSTQEQVEEIERSREVLIDAFTGERRRIERELHDGVQQYLTALQLNIATLELSMDSPSESATESIEQAKLNARRALEALRSTIRGIYPQVLQDMGLVAALRELVAHSGIEGEVLVAASPGASDHIEGTPALLMYHCAAEGITNAVRHGKATHVCIRVHFDHESTVLAVDDDGIGVQEGVEKQSSSGTGTAGLQERAAALRGAVVLEPSALMRGACLRIKLPRIEVISAAESL
ncbi:histidine kinase [Corynebacterium durum]|uniref:sensor histidine kinase n=1 Tax=Corynebacterium durum TaxID=61592 RepID=UPI0028E4378B|nr:histidine kinase [Corynebacterium durum]